MKFEAFIGSGNAGKTVFHFLSGRIKEVGKTRLEVMFHKGMIRVNGASAKSGTILEKGDSVEADWSELRRARIFAERIPLEIVYEDEEVLVLIKPAGMACHAGLGVFSGTLLNAARAYFESQEATAIENGLVHRLDKETEGLMVLAKTGEARANLFQQMRSKTASREYLAMVGGIPQPEQGSIKFPVGRDPDRPQLIRAFPDGRGGKATLTGYITEKKGEACSWLRCSLTTGRTHQVRVHLSAIGNPVFGDRRYGGPQWPRLMLFSVKLDFVHPTSGKEMHFSYLPTEFEQEIPC